MVNLGINLGMGIIYFEGYTLFSFDRRARALVREKTMIIMRTRLFVGLFSRARRVGGRAWRGEERSLVSRHGA